MLPAQLDSKFCLSHPVLSSKFIKPKQVSVFSIHGINGIKLLSQLRLNVGYLNEHKFQHIFKDTTGAMCSCGLKPEIAFHYLLRCNLYSTLRAELLVNDIYTHAQSVKSYAYNNLLEIILYGSEKFNLNKEILKSTIKFTKASERFDLPLYRPLSI